MRTILLAGTAAIVGLLPVMAQAQDRTAQPPAAAGESGTTPEQTAVPSSSATNANSQGATAIGLQDIIVTAQRRAESVQRAAIAINVVGGADLVAAGVTDSTELNRLVPALTIESVGTQNVTFVRGVGNFSVAVTSDPAVAFNYDGVYLGRPTSSSGTFFDLDRVEVLKGPQGTLYGRNATAGAINVLPTQPKIGELSGYGTISYGNYNALVAEGAINVPLGATGAARLSATVTDRDGYLSDGSSDDKTQAIRFQLKSNLTPALTARVAFDYSHNGGKGGGLSIIDTYGYSAAAGGYVVRPTGISTSDGTGSANSQQFFTSLPTATAKRNRDPFPALRRDNDYVGITGDVSYDTGIGTLTVIPAVRFDDLSYVDPGGAFPIGARQKDIQYSVEARLAGKLSLFDYTIGGYYYNEDVDLKETVLILGSIINSQNDTHQQTQSYAPFGRLTAHLTNKLRVVGGIRYSHDDRQYASLNSTYAVVCVAAACPTTPLPVISIGATSGQPFPLPAASGGVLPTGYPGSIVSRTDVNFHNTLSNGKVTYRGAVEYDVLPASLLYASVETGFRSGGFSNAVGFETFQPETLTAYTVGAKNRFFNNRLQFNIEGFWWKYNNEQVAHPGVDLIGRNANFTQNVGRSTIKGVEAEARVLVTRNTVLNADVQYLDARDNQYVYQGLGTQVGVGQYAPPFTNCRTTPNGVQTQVGALAPTFTVNCSGFPGYNSPKITVNFGGEQTIPYNDYKFVVSGNTQHKSSYYTYFDYASVQIQRAFWETDAGIAFGPKNDRWSIAGYVRNIEDHRLLVAPVAFGGLIAAYTSAPRTYGGRVSVRF